MLESGARPAFKALNNWVGVDQVIAQRVNRLRRSGVGNEVLRGEGSELWAGPSNDPEREIHVTESCAGGHDAARLDDHVGFVQHHVRIPFAKHGREPPGGGGAMMVEQAGL